MLFLFFLFLTMIHSTIIVPNLVIGRKGGWKLNGSLLRYQHSWIDRQIGQPLLVLLGVEL